MQKIKVTFWVLLCSMSLVSCTTVKPYQRTYLNDPEMEPGMHTAQKMEQDAQTIREGASTPGGAKTSGGCGCN